jgi:uridine monophosphate synthetase
MKGFFMIDHTKLYALFCLLCIPALHGNSTKHTLACQLYDIGALKFGEFKLKSGITSPIYIDMRLLVSYPKLLKTVATALHESITASQATLVCGVPMAGIPLATACSLENNLPMILCRPQAKDHGTKKCIEGIFKEGELCILIEDVVTSGQSSMETIRILEQHGLVVKTIIALVDREQGGATLLNKNGYQLSTLFTLNELLDILTHEHKIDAHTAQRVQHYCAATRSPECSLPEKAKTLTYGQRAQICTHPIARKLFTVMEEKQTNLCVAADVTTQKELLQLIEQIGPEICLLKLHIDSIEDYDATLPQVLKRLAQHYNFVIFEDRKFADIGATVQKQCSGGIYHISDWAEIVTVHTIAGDGTLKGIKAANKDLGQVLLAQMSSEGTLINDDYTRATVEMAQQNIDCTVGLICRKKLSDNPALIHMTPGVHLQSTGDSLGQQYLTPEMVIGNYQSDIIIVGRGITHAHNPREAAQLYRLSGWNAYQQKTKSVHHHD